MIEHDQNNYLLHSANALDQLLQTNIAELTRGISPAAVLVAFYDWSLHLLFHPAKQIELMLLGQQNCHYLMQQYFNHLTGNTGGEYCLIRPPQDNRFTTKEWQAFPYTFIYESFCLIQNWWHCAATNVRGVSCHHEEVVDFTLRQLLDIVSPANSILTNPEVQHVTMTHSGQNLLKGYENFLDDMQHELNNLPPAGAENFVVGKNIAVTPGKVIYRNKLIELIQYEPTTAQVYPQPILITPAWIMKYYILDLAPKHSLVKYLVDNGYTVFIISWKNPQKKDRDISMSDYLELGVMHAINAITTIVPQQKVHLIGYCLGGTLTAIAAATMARDNDDRLASMTLLAAQTDFTEPGELDLFIDESQIAFLETMMKEKGYLETQQMSGTFQLLHSNDLIWSRMIRDYLLGERKPMTDLMAWNADTTRMPYKMHSDYLRNLFLHNQLAAGKYLVNGKPIALTDISIPMFVVATERDHISPWQSVFKINLLTSGDVTFTLTSGGHNAGIVSMPTTHTKSYYRSSNLKESDRYIDAQSWYESTKLTNGSWWPALEEWLVIYSGEKMMPPALGAPKAGYVSLTDAPGDVCFGEIKRVMASVLGHSP